MYRIFKIIFLFVLALLTGFMIVVQWSLVPAQNGLDGPAYATLEKGMNGVMQTLTPTLMIAALATGAALVWLARERQPILAALYGVAVLALAAMIVSTLLINAPINAAIDSWNVNALPADWMTLRDRWEFGHALRSYVGLVGLLAAIIGMSADTKFATAR